MAEVNKDFFSKYKGKVIGFTANGFGVVPGGIRGQGSTTCACCGQIITMTTYGEMFCPVCSVFLGLVEYDLAKEVIEESLSKRLRMIIEDKNNVYYIAHELATTSFKNGIRFANKHSITRIDPNLKISLL